MGHEFTITDERFEALCSSMDADGSGTVDFEELLLMQARTSMIGFATDLSGIEEEDDLLQTLPTLGFEIPADRRASTQYAAGAPKTGVTL